MIGDSLARSRGKWDASEKVAREEGEEYVCPPPSRATILMGILMF